MKWSAKHFIIVNISNESTTMGKYRTKSFKKTIFMIFLYKTFWYFSVVSKFNFILLVTFLLKLLHLQTFAIQCSRRCVLLHWTSCKCNYCWPQISAANGGTGGEFGTIKVSEIFALSFIIKLENNLAAANWQKSRATKAQRKRQWKNDVNAWEHRRVGWLLLETRIQMKGFSQYNALGKCAERKMSTGLRTTMKILPK